MNPRNVKILAVVVLVLFGVLFALNSADRSDSPADGQMLFPELKSRLNDLNVVSITDADGTITLRRESGGESAAGRWISSDHDGYPADTGTLRQLLLAIADARKLEQKTSDPELYERLGVADPRKGGGNGILVSARGDDAAVSVILGDTAQREYRYARLPEEGQSWLINQNPNLPDDSAGWLLPEIVDIDASRIEAVVIRHADGEEVGIRKDDADAVNFEVENIPEGRELRYPSVANGIAGVLSDLTLQDVQSGDRTSEEASVAEFTTFDGLQLLVRIDSRPDEAAADEANAEPAEEQQHWITLEASANEAIAASPETAGNDEAADETDVGPAGEATSASADREPDTAAAEGEDQVIEDLPGASEEAAEINERVGGWSYLIAGYKADQLTRRLEDLLSEEEDAEAE